VVTSSVGRMLGFDDRSDETRSSYGLMSEVPSGTRRRAKWTATLVLLFGSAAAAGTLAYFTLVQGQSKAPVATAYDPRLETSWLPVLAIRDSASFPVHRASPLRGPNSPAKPVGAPKPFGMCMLNLTLAGLNATSSSCPEGFHCAMFGPVFGMCLPDVMPASTMLKAVDAKPEAEAADPCPTKPFEQCAGMNFTDSKAEAPAYNFSTAARQTVCCPAGTVCVSFGPVWGQCMPSWVAAVQLRG